MVNYFGINEQFCHPRAVRLHLLLLRPADAVVSGACLVAPSVFCVVHLAPKRKDPMGEGRGAAPMEQDQAADPPHAGPR